jgi:hypothetical protein
VKHPLLGLWIVMVDDPSAQQGRGPLVGRADGDLFVLGFRDVRRARAAAEQSGGGDPVLIVSANLNDIAAALVSQGISGVVVDWVPGQPTIEEAHSLI